MNRIRDLSTVFNCFPFVISQIKGQNQMKVCGVINLPNAYLVLNENQKHEKI